MSRNEWNFSFGDNISHFARWNRDELVMHPLPTTTQGSCHHCYEVNTCASREISNHHFILFCARRWIRTHDVNMSIPWWRNFCSWQNNNLQSLSNLPPICLLCWKLQICCWPNCLIIASFWPSGWIYRSIKKWCTFTHKKGPRSTFSHFTQNKSCLLQCCDLKLNQVGPYLYWLCWGDKWSIDTILPSSSSNTMS